MAQQKPEKARFISDLQKLCAELSEIISTDDGFWTVKGFIDVSQNIYSIPADTKVLSKILETQLFHYLSDFAQTSGYEIVLAEHQNWYPDMSFIKKTDNSVKFAVDIKTSYRQEEYDGFCSGFTLGSYGQYFRDRTSSKNIQFPYGDYSAHIVLGIIYTRVAADSICETEISNVPNLSSITSVISDLLLFAQEKWKIAGSGIGSGNTRNIGSINYIPDILSGNGTFAKLGEPIFDEYWSNRETLEIPNPQKPGENKILKTLEEFLEHKGMDKTLINIPRRRRKENGK